MIRAVGRPLRAIFVGFGSVGRAVAAILADPSPYPGLRALEVRVVGITTGSKGALVCAGGIDLASALREMRIQGAFTLAHPDRSHLSTAKAVATLEYDVLVEMSPLDVARHGEPAITYARTALQRGRHVVTANKGPIAWAYRPLRELARRNSCAFLHESTVMDGAPVFNLARHCLRGATILRLEGILNSTTNSVLCAMEEGSTLEAAVRTAQNAGFAEADPSLDLDGWDAAVKVAALANVLMEGDLRPEAVTRDRLAGVDPTRVREAPGLGRRVKMVCEAVRDGGRGVVGRVQAREVPLQHPFALLRGSGSILRITTDLLGTITLTEEAPDLRTTAYGILSDLLSLTG